MQGEVDLIDETCESRRGLCRPDLVQPACHGEGDRGICFVTPGEEVTNTKEVIGEEKLRLDDLQSSMGWCGRDRMAQLSGDAGCQSRFERKKLLVLTEKYSPQTHGVHQSRDRATWASWGKRDGMSEAGGMQKEMR